MQHWSSPFPLPSSTETLLRASGLQAWPADKPLLDPGDCLLLYDSPDQLILAAAGSAGTQAPSLQQLRQGYRSLLEASEKGGHLAAIWQIAQLSQEHLQHWFNHGEPATGAGHAPPERLAPDPLVAVATLGLIEAEPALLHAYSDLELRAQLLGREPDLRLRQRLLQTIDPAHLWVASIRSVQSPQALQALQEELQSREAELRDTRTKAELTLLQLHEAQEELAQTFLAQRQKQQQLTELEQQLQALQINRQAWLNEQAKLQEQLQSQQLQNDAALTELKQQLDSRSGDLNSAQEETTLILVQLNQTQEELEHIFLADRHKQQQLADREQQLQALELSQKTWLNEQTKLRNQLHLQQQQSDAALTELKQQLESRSSDLNSAREEARLSLLQLHQVQEELEHYFLLSRGQDQLLAHYSDLQQRVQGVLSRLMQPSHEDPLKNLRILQ